MTVASRGSGRVDPSTVAIWIAWGVVWWLLWQLGLRSWRKLWPRPRPGWLGRGLLDRLRPVIWPSDRLVDWIGPRPGMQVIEASAGTERLTDLLVRAVGSSGQVVAIDERLDVVEALQRTALTNGQSTLTVLHSPATLLPAEPASMDLVVLTSVFGGAPDPTAIVTEAIRVLRPGGMLAVSEFLVDADYSLASTVVTHMVLAGFGIERERGGLLGYTVIGRKPGYGV